MLFSAMSMSPPRAGLSPQHVTGAQPDGVRVSAAAAVHHDGGVGLPHRPARRHRQHPRHRSLHQSQEGNK